MFVMIFMTFILLVMGGFFTYYMFFTVDFGNLDKDRAEFNSLIFSSVVADSGFNSSSNSFVFAFDYSGIRPILFDSEDFDESFISYQGNTCVLSRVLNSSGEFDEKLVFQPGDEGYFEFLGCNVDKSENLIFGNISFRYDSYDNPTYFDVYGNFSFYFE